MHYITLNSEVDVFILLVYPSSTSKLSQIMATAHPLSEVKKTSVLSSTPAVFRKSNICPTAQSSSLRESPNGPLILEFVNILLAN